MATQFITYTSNGLQIVQTKETSAKCLLKLCKHTKTYMHVYTTDIIENTFTSQATQNWESNDCNQNILASIGVLICRVADTDSQKCTQYMLSIIQKFIQPLKEKLQLFDE